jgi:hypothetical protein
VSGSAHASAPCQVKIQQASKRERAGKGGGRGRRERLLRLVPAAREEFHGEQLGGRREEKGKIQSALSVRRLPFVAAYHQTPSALACHSQTTPEYPQWDCQALGAEALEAEREYFLLEWERELVLGCGQIASEPVIHEMW